MTLIEKLVDDARSVFSAPASANELVAARRVLADTLACAVAGAHEFSVTAVCSVMRPDPQGIPLPGSGRRVSAADAQLALSSSIRALDLNDVFSARNNHHPSEVAIPPVVAEAYLRDCSIGELLDNIARAYRISLGIGELWSGLLGQGWAPTATLGRVSGPLLGAFLRGADDTQAAHAVAIGALTAPTLGVVFRGQLSSSKNLVNGMAARAAWEAADLAMAGLTGPLDALDGEGGFETAVASSHLSAMPALGVPDVSLKAYPTVFMSHASIAAALELAPQFRRGDIEAVSVAVPEAVAAMSTAQSKWSLTTREEAQFSVPVTVAVALATGSCGLQDLENAIAHPDAIRAILDRMTVEVSTELRDGYEGGRVTVRAGGVELSAIRQTPPGHPATPLSDDQLRHKMRDLMSAHIGPEGADRLLHMLDQGDVSTRAVIDATVSTS